MKSPKQICARPARLAKGSGRNFFSKLAIRRKSISDQNDGFEKEADRAAEEVMKEPGGNSPAFFHPTATTSFSVQRKATSDLSSDKTSSLRQTLSSKGQPLDKDARSFMEQRFGHDFGDVEVHNDSRAHESAASINALAYSSGKHVAFANGNYNPHTHSGKKLIAHELAHVIQNRKGGGKGVQRKVDCKNKTTLKAEIDACLKGINVADKKSIKTALLCLGITEAMMGNLDTLFSGVADPDAEKKRVGSAMTGPEITAAFELLGTMVPGSQGGAVFGSCNRIISAWNVAKDDLGPSDIAKRGRYPTILHYMKELIFLGSSGSTTTSASAYTEFTKNAPAVSLAGAESGIMNVHPRNVYFVAAAQVTMDTISNLDETFEVPGTAGRLARLHYIAPAGFPKQITLLSNKLKGISKIKSGKQVPDTWLLTFNEVVVIFSQFLNGIRNQLDIENTTTAGDEESHSEKKFLQWVKSNLSFFDTLKVIDADEKQTVPVAAKQLLDVLKTIPKGMDLAHGFGALDPHGTDHALGFAIDLFNARSGEHNAAFRHPEYIPFLNYLMDNFTHSYLEGTEQHEINFEGTRINHIDQLPPEKARDFSILLQEKGIAAYESIVDDQTVTKIDAKELKADAAVIASVKKKFGQVTKLLSKLIDKNHKEITKNKELVSRIETLNRRIAYHVRILTDIPPDLASTLLRSDIDMLSDIAISSMGALFVDNGSPLNEGITALEEQLKKFEGRKLDRTEKLEQKKLLAKLTKAKADDKRLTAIISELDVIGKFDNDPVESSPLDEAAALLDEGLTTGMQERYLHRQHAQLLKIVKPKSFKKWLDNIVAMGIYTQPPLMVNAINKVRTFPDQEKMEPGKEFRHSRFQAGHHWQVAPREIITNDVKYSEALLRDMKQRDAATLKRIIRTINEWSKAKKMLTADEVFIKALGKSIIKDGTEDDLTAGVRLITKALDDVTGEKAIVP